ncbi:hypothetical protein N7463_010239 [Penicillium fimorum]|uniref:Uncharacterized protein n=1 Tax=Penicillium fimorum TaxID=1882269 RepID=A0A9X0C146_9EURO|nr:hypothetical protein N7463_010239 [Penicillium fimorum]
MSVDIPVGRDTAVSILKQFQPITLVGAKIWRDTPDYALDYRSRSMAPRLNGLPVGILFLMEVGHTPMGVIPEISITAAKCKALWKILAHFIGVHSFLQLMQSA